ncbi:5-oxoprolinase subunit PxpA [Flavivirga jejuensis]|uniref:5-oxoprolinase subunit PxpA n=1 Tax=Flavivirga jejuensis TaxID=870487 RepID=A0ABT8WPY7_9FLAO|nr:5-oxoprolinase subunit PxpA [Flavivirga jejuensis]MDO5975232.1 5-oxoprolinase subunit PxpA [Flavivirga jejuensis]
MIPKTIDINVDVGEGIGNESELMPFISSCNIACGGHAGNTDTMRNVVKLAKKYRVKIGAHPSFPDKVNFGRINMEMSNEALFKSIKDQIDDLVAILDEEQEPLHHVKPHGALYNLAAVDEKIAHIVIEVIKTISSPVKLYVPFKSEIEKLAISQNIPIIYEAFADRNYNDDLTLVSRKKEAASIHNENHLFEHIFYMILKQKVKTITGKDIDIKVQTFCIHGDNPNAVNLIKNLELRLKKHSIQIK